MTLHPTSLPSQSIVCIRHLCSTTRLWSARMALPQHDQDWQRQLQAQIDTCVANAARPAIEFVPTNANAVMFKDEAEQLACLAHDWLRGVVRQQWWWTFLLLRGGVDEVLHAAWLHASAHGPAALAQLTVHDEAVPFLNRLPNAIVLEVLLRVVTVFGLRDLASVLSRLWVTTLSADSLQDHLIEI